jgi:molybdopterin synthase sulfur carrier subunit
MGVYMKVKVLFFGELSERFEKERYLQVGDVQGVLEELTAEWPAFAKKQVSVAVNAQIVHDNVLLKEGDVVAIMPPFSGG